MKIPKDFVISSPFLSNYFCPINKTGLAFVVIAKNCVTFLKQLAIYYKTGTVIETEPQIHQVLGYNEKSGYLIPFDKLKQYEIDNGELLKFAVWRDPVERLVSNYKFFCLEREYREYFRYLGFSNEKIEFDRFMKFVEFELTKIDPLFHDEHIRRQSDYYNLDDVDIIVKDKDLNKFLEKQGVKLLVSLINQTKVDFVMPNIYKERIIELYKTDYELLNSTKVLHL